MPNVRSDCGGVFITDVTVDLAAFTASDSADVVVAVPDIKADDVVISVIGPAALDDDVTYSHAIVTAAGSVTVRFANVGAGTPNPASGTYRFVVCRR